MSNISFGGVKETSQGVISFMHTKHVIIVINRDHE